MESLHFLNIIFAYFPGEKLTGPSESDFSYFPAEIVEYSFHPRCKIGLPPGQLDRVFPNFPISDMFDKNKLQLSQ